jgi:hypothetical protein
LVEQISRVLLKDLKDFLEDYEGNISNFVKEYASVPFDLHNIAKG